MTSKPPQSDFPKSAATAGAVDSAIPLRHPQPCGLTEIRTCAGHGNPPASQYDAVVAACAAYPGKWELEKQ